MVKKRQSEGAIAIELGEIREINGHDPYTGQMIPVRLVITEVFKNSQGIWMAKGCLTRTEQELQITVAELDRWKKIDPDRV